MHILISCLPAARLLNVALMRPWEMSEIEHSHRSTATAKRKPGKVPDDLERGTLCKCQGNCLRVELNMKSICHSWVTIWKQTCVPDLCTVVSYQNERFSSQ